MKKILSGLLLLFPVIALAAPDSGRSGHGSGVHWQNQYQSSHRGHDYDRGGRNTHKKHTLTKNRAVNMCLNQVRTKAKLNRSIDDRYYRDSAYRNAYGNWVVNIRFQQKYMKGKKMPESARCTFNNEKLYARNVIVKRGW